MKQRQAIKFPRERKPKTGKAIPKTNESLMNIIYSQKPKVVCSQNPAGLPKIPSLQGEALIQLLLEPIDRKSLIFMY